MFLTNHVLTGIALGLVIDNPVLLAPTAIASHLALDMTPHFGFDRPKTEPPNFRTRTFIVWGVLDGTTCLVILATACLVWPQRTLQLVVGAAGAALPDLTYLPITIFGDKRIYRLPGYQAMIKFLAGIQWYEKPPGLITEVAWLGIILTLLHSLLP